MRIFQRDIQIPAVLSYIFRRMYLECVLHREYVSLAGPIVSISDPASRILRQIFHSAYYGAPVFVKVLKCDPTGPMAFNREVNLVVNNRVSGSSAFAISLNLFRFA